MNNPALAHEVLIVVYPHAVKRELDVVLLALLEQAGVVEGPHWTMIMNPSLIARYLPLAGKSVERHTRFLLGADCYVGVFNGFGAIEVTLGTVDVVVDLAQLDEYTDFMPVSNVPADMLAELLPAGLAD